MKRICLIAFLGVLGTSAAAWEYDDGSVVTRAGVYRGAAVTRAALYRGVAYRRGVYDGAVGWNGGVNPAGAVVRATAARAYDARAAYASGAYAPVANMAPVASSMYATEPYASGAWDNRGDPGSSSGAYLGYPTRAIYRAGLISSSYYGPICNPRFDALCQ